jgi:hypothetical protein
VRWVPSEAPSTGYQVNSRLIMAFCIFARIFTPISMAQQKESREPRRKKVILLLAAAGLPLFGILFSLSSFELRFINPRTNQQTVSLVALTLLVSLLFGALTFVLFRNLIKVSDPVGGG